MRRKGAPFDTLGLCLLSLTMICWEIVLSKGQEWDWFGDPFYRGADDCSVLFVVGLVTLIWRETADFESAASIFEPCADRNFRWSLHHYFLRLRGALR